MSLRGIDPRGAAARVATVGRRCLVAAAFALVAAIVFAPSAGHAAPRPRPAVSRADSAAAAAQPKTAPWKVMARSAIVPGWGQMYNHQPLKAALVVAGEGTLVALALHELKLQNDAKQAAVDAEFVNDTAGANAAILEADIHRNRKISWIWWGVAVHLLSMADAYVDAHLSTFDSDFGKKESLLGPRPGAVQEPTISLAYRVSF